jgi:hypothetical protein
MRDISSKTPPHTTIACCGATHLLHCIWQDVPKGLASLVAQVKVRDTAAGGEWTGYLLKHFNGGDLFLTDELKGSGHCKVRDKNTIEATFLASCYSEAAVAKVTMQEEVGGRVEDL